MNRWLWLTALADSNVYLSDIYGEIGVSAPFTVTKSDHSACYVDNLNVHVCYYFVWSYICLGLPWTLFVSEKPQIALQVNHCLCYCVWQGRKSPPWQVRTLGCEAYPMVATNINPKFVGGCLFYNESLATHGLLKEFFVEVRLVPSIVVLRNLSQSRSRSLIAMFSIQPPMYVHLIRGCGIHLQRWGGWYWHNQWIVLHLMFYVLAQAALWIHIFQLLRMQW